MSFQEILDEYGPQWTLQLIPLCGPQHGCAHPGKTPHLNGWNKLPEKRRTQRQTPKSVAVEMAKNFARGGNVGLAVPVGVIVLDADSTEARAFLASASPDTTPCQETARGAHFVFKLHSGLDFRNHVAVEMLGHRIDIRGYGSQITVQPSVHHTGALYRWQRSLPDRPEDLPPLPPAIANALAASSAGGKRRSAEEWRELVGEGVAKGERHASLCAVAGKVFASNLEPGCAYHLLHAWNQASCKPPLPRAEADRIIRDVAARECERRARR
jgi:hypothetical protein